jgi:hypothetical protein
MSDAMQILVDIDVGLAGAEAAGDEVVAWLTERQLLGPSFLIERTVGNPFGGPVQLVRDKRVWPPGSRALSAVEPQRKGTFDFRKRDPNHVETRVGRALHAQEGAQCHCPSCKNEIHEYWDIVSPWVECGTESLQCPGCRSSITVKDLGFVPSGAAGALAIVFNNWWPLRPGVVEGLSGALGHRLRVAWDFC